MNIDLISREALKKKLQARHDNGEEDFDKGYNIGIETAIDLIDNAPTVEAVPLDFHEKCMDKTVKELLEARPKGEWLEPYESHIAQECSICHRQMPAPKWFNFCPNCGADMRGGGE